jgi:hypothetical protein
MKTWQTINPPNEAAQAASRILDLATIRSKWTAKLVQVSNFGGTAMDLKRLKPTAEAYAPDKPDISGAGASYF